MSTTKLLFINYNLCYYAFKGELQTIINGKATPILFYFGKAHSMNANFGANLTLFIKLKHEH